MYIKKKSVYRNMIKSNKICILSTYNEVKSHLEKHTHETVVMSPFDEEKH